MYNRFSRKTALFVAPLVVVMIGFGSISCAHRPKAPPQTGLLTDTANVFDVESKKRVGSLLLDLKRVSGIELMLLTVSTTKWMPISRYATQVVENWNLDAVNRRSKGVLLVVFAVKDGMSWTAVSPKLQTDFPNEVGRQLLPEPEKLFRQTKYAEGLETYVNLIIHALQKARGFSFSRDYAPEAGPTGVSVDLQKAATTGKGVRVQGRTPLMTASMKGDTKTVKLLLKKGSDINVKNNHGLTALNYAVNNNQASVVRLLIRHGANVNQRDEIGDTPLITAAGRGNIEAATALRDYGADVNARTRGGGTALMRAALSGQSAMVRFLLENGADATARDKRGRSALDAAQTRKIKKLIKKAARKN